jgi:hypothetical protein
MNQFHIGDTVEGCGFTEAVDRNGMRAVVKGESIGVYELEWADGQRALYCEGNVRPIGAKALEH